MNITGKNAAIAALAAWALAVVPALEAQEIVRAAVSPGAAMNGNAVLLNAGQTITGVMAGGGVRMQAGVIYNLAPASAGCTDPGAPQIVHASGESGETRPFSGFIDPRLESSNGVDLDAGIDRLIIVFNTPVFDLGSTASGTQPGMLTPAAFEVLVTGGDAPAVDAVNLLAPEVVEVVLDAVIPVREWTTVVAAVENACGVAVQNSGDLGPGQPEPDRLDVGFLPGDVDQNATVTPLDLLRYRQAVQGTWTPPAGEPADLLDTDRNGVTNPLDLLRFRQVLLGVPPATQAWSQQSMNHAQP